MEQLSKEKLKEAIDWIETSPACHFRLREAWNKFKDCDPVDVFEDSQILFGVLESRIRH